MIFLALTTFEHGDGEGDYLPLRFQGACGWIAIKAADAVAAVEILRKSLSADRLILVEADCVHGIEIVGAVRELDIHLPDNT
jgi:hypothetical protein